MSFDLAAARNAGYSDSEIVDFLGRQRNFNVAGAREAGYNDSEILGYLGVSAEPQQRRGPEQEPVPERGILGTVGARAGDVLGSVVSGAGSVATGIGGLAGVTGAVSQDNMLTRLGRGVSELGSGLMSPELRNQRRVLSAAVKEAEERGLGAEAAAALQTLATNPGLLASMAIEQIPAFILSGGAGRAASLAGQVATRGGVRAGTMAAERATEVASRAGQAGAVGTAAGLQAGSVSTETYQEVMNLPIETLQRSPVYQDLLRTMSPNDARAAVADRAAREAGLLGGGISVGTMALLPSAEAAMFSRGVSRRAIARALGVGAGEATSEGIEEGGGQFAQNLAIQRQADAERSLTRGVGGAAATGAVLGGVAGSAIGALQRPPEVRTDERPELRRAIEEYVAGREPLPEETRLLPREPRIDTPVGDLSRYQLLSYMERSLPRIIQDNPDLASRMEYARNEDERLDVFREYLKERQEDLAAIRQQDEVSRIPPRPDEQPDLLNRPPQPEPTKAPAGPLLNIPLPVRPVTQTNAETPTPQAETFNIPVGRQFTVATPDGSMNVDVVPEVVDLFSLTPASGGLQNRMIDNPANQATINNIANAPDFARLGTSPYSDRGAPIIGPDNVIEIGNHRVEGLKRAAENNPEAFKSYVSALNGAGYDTTGMQFPVLIRRRVSELTPEQRQDFTRLSNSEANQVLSDLELARQDASLLTPELLAKFDGEVSGGVRAAKNLPFVRDFLTQATTPSERTRLISPEGGISDALADRLEMALFASAYNDISLIKRAVETGDDDTKSITGGMIEATGAMQELRRGIDEGRIRPEFDIVPALVKAADRIRAGKANGLTPGDIIATEDMLNPIPPVEREAIRLFSNDSLNKIASKSAIGKRLKAYVEEAKTQSPVTDLVGGERRITPEEALVIARNPGQASMFSARRVGEKETEAAPQPEEEQAPNVDRARKIITKFFDELRAEGRQGRLIAKDLTDLIRDRKMNANQIYQAFIAAKVISKTLPGKADFRLRFLQDIVVDNEQAGRASGATVGQRAQGRVIYPTDSLPGFIELSLAPDMLPFLRETAAHEAFHVLQSYFSAYDKNFSDRVDRFFKDGMKVSDLEPSIKKRLMSLKAPDQNVSYYQVLEDSLGDSTLSAKEAQAYAFGALIDAANRGQKVTGLIPSFQRFFVAARAFFSGMKRALRGDGFESPSDILTAAQRRGRAMEQAAPVVGGQALSGRNPAEAITTASEANIQYLQGLITAKERDAKVAASGVRYSVIDSKNNRRVGSWPTMARATAEAEKRNQQYGAQVFSVKAEVREPEAGYSARRVTDRDPVLEEAARGVREGTVSREQYEQLVNERKPVTPYSEVPEPATLSEITNALDSDKVPKIGVPSKTLKEGDLVGLRLDIPAYSKHNTWVVSVHEAKGKSFYAGTVIGYEPTAVATDVQLGVVSGGAMKIAAGDIPKTTIAVMRGKWKPTTPEQAKARADEVLNNPDWVQVGMDPRRHQYFYDRTTKEPVVAADEVIQIGPLVLAKNPTYASKSDYQYSARRVPNYAARTTATATPKDFFQQVKTQINEPSVFDKALSVLLDKKKGETIGQAFARTSINRAASLYNLDQIAKKDGYTGRSAAKAMELALQNTGRMAQLLTSGMGKINPKTGGITLRKDVKPLFEIMKGANLKTERLKDEFQVYLAALRERDLRTRGRKGFFDATPAQISDWITRSEAAHPEWVKSAAELDKLNNALVDWALDTGLVDAAQSKTLRDVFYTPFYRLMDKDSIDDPTRSISPKIGESFTNVASAINREMKGGTKPLGDLYENIIRNADSIMKAGLKNLAMREAAKTMEFAKLGRKVSTKDPNSTIVYKVDGKDVIFEVDDAALFAALSGMPRHMQNGIYNTMAKMAAIFRDFITVAPSFMLTNLWRGKISAYVQEGQPFMTNTFAGLRDALKASSSLQNFQLQTGFGGMEYGMGERDMAAAFERKLTDEGVGAALKKGKVLSAIRQGFNKMQEISEATEMAERIKLAENLMKGGMSKEDAEFQAYLLAPYSRRGTGQGWVGSTLQWLMPLVPFMNAKLQTTYRLFENEKGDKRRLWTLGIPQQIFLRGLVVTGFSLLAYLANLADDEKKWDDIPSYMKLNYDMIPLGDGYITLPRAFEIGQFFGALPIFILDAVRRGESRDLAAALAEVGLNTFWMNPTPQAIKPIFSIWTNYDFFRGRPLETMSDQNLPVEERANRSTTTAGRVLAGTVNAVAGSGVLSPIRAQALLDGYTGTLGTSLMAAFDSALAGVGAIPGKPAGAFGNFDLPANLLGANRFYREGERTFSRFVGDFYKIKEITDQLVRSQNLARETRNFERLEELRGEAGAPLRIRQIVNRASEQISELNRRIARIERSDDLDGVAKAQSIEPLVQRRNEIARGVVERARAAGAF